MILTKNFENPIIQVDSKGKILSHKNIFQDATKSIDSNRLKSVLSKISKVSILKLEIKDFASEIISLVILQLIIN